MNSWYVLMIYCVIFLILVVLTIVFLWKFILALVKKKLNQRIVICFLLSIGMLGVVIVFGCSHSTYYKYNDWFILGNSISAVEKRYGKFDLDNKKGEVGYYIYTDNG